MSGQSPFLPECLKGKTAIITGGGGGIGLEITRQLGLHGARVVIMGRRAAPLDAACQQLQSEGIQALAVPADVRKLEDCSHAVQRAQECFGSVDVLVNCAAGNFLSPAELLTPNGFRTVMEIDTVGTFTMSKAAFPALRQSGSTCIINISMTLHYGATWYQTHAAAAKAGVDAMTRSLALEWGSYGIRVNGVAPGPVADTVGMNKLGIFGVKGRQEEAVKRIPLGRMGAKWDIAIACVFLCSSAARWISGDTLVVDGAEWLYKPPVAPREVISEISKKLEVKKQQQADSKHASKL